jgi:hypothetical protein
MKFGEIAFDVEANVHTILQAERLVLNTMQRMSGIATLTKKYTDKLKGYKTKLLDTRKTTPNFRLLEKEAVKIGGGTNHRFGLYDMIMLKDNHIDYCGGIEKAINLNFIDNLLVAVGGFSYDSNKIWGKKLNNDLFIYDIYNKNVINIKSEQLNSTLKMS